jgi:glyoxylase-like metal-dependent hydrolase (beta-lactamase superfamily II)
MKLTQVKGNTYYINPNFIDLGFYRINEKKTILIDSGFHKTAKNEIIPFMRSRNMIVSGVLCTHGHIDHAGGNNILKKEFGAQIATPYTENILCENSYNMYVLSDHLRFRVYGETIPYYEYKTDVIIYPDYEDIYFLGVDFKILKINGHSPYQIGYITPDNVAYLGDSLLSEEMVEKTKLPYIFDIGEDMRSKNYLKNLECDKYILSHSGVYDDISLLINKNIEHIQSRIEILLDLLKEPSTFDEYTAKIIERLDIYDDLRKIVYIQRTVRSYLSYFQDMNLVDTYIKNHQILFFKK